MLSEEQAQRLAARWVDAFNRRDLKDLLAHYAEDVEFTSPFVVQVLNDPSGTLRGKKHLEVFLALALSLFPDLNFTVIQVFSGVSSLVIHYRGVDDILAAEMLILNSEGLIQRVYCHYAT